MKKFIAFLFLCVFLSSCVITGCSDEELQRAKDAGVDLNSEPAIKIIEEAEARSSAEEPEGGEIPYAGVGRLDAELLEGSSADRAVDEAMADMADGIKEIKDNEKTGVDALSSLNEGEDDTPLLDAALSEDTEPDLPPEADVDRQSDQEGADTDAQGADADQPQAEDGAAQGEQTGDAGSETAPEQAQAVPAAGGGRLIAIDAGHQAKGNSEKEPIGPGAAETKAKVAGGTRGAVSGLAEYQLTLMVAQKLKSVLQSRGYSVLMIRESHDVNISNAERAQMANNAGAAAFIRIHANGSDNSAVSGALTMCQSASNPYNGSLADKSYKLSSSVLNGVVGRCGCANKGVTRTDTMSGINWCQVPVTIVEMGFMTNPNEDALMATDDYQQKLAEGMADGIDAYFR